MQYISYAQLLDKIHGGWYAKCLGGAAGAPVEGVKKIIDVDDFTAIYNPELPNDDLDIQLLWLEVLETKGVYLNSCDLADAWQEKCWYPFSEYGYFMKNYRRGVKPPYTGIINNSFFQEGMGCPIRSEIWGFICAGNPQLAISYAYMDATLDHAGNSVYAEQFLAAVESMAFFESELPKLLQMGLTMIPADCKLSRCIRLVMAYHGSGMGWRKAREEVLRQFGHPDFSNVTQNMGMIIIALLYGNGDLRKTINIALQCGYDADCTCATAAAIVGVIQGYRGLGADICSFINNFFVVGIDVRRPTNNIDDLARDTCNIALLAPNDMVEITDVPDGLAQVCKPTGFTGFPMRIATSEGLEQELKKIKPMKWEAFGPFFSPLEKQDDPKYPSPHGEGCVLPTLECMVNNTVALSSAYIDEQTLDFEGIEAFDTLLAYEDLIPLEAHITMEGQMCVYLRTEVFSAEDSKVWVVIGNSDGFRLWNNKKIIIERDEIRYWTPYNNFELMELQKGKNELVIKLLRRTEAMKVSVGFREYDGTHWHKSQWRLDIP